MGAGAYVVYDCAIVMREGGTTMRILKRYSAFEELEEGLKRLSVGLFLLAPGISISSLFSHLILSPYSFPENYPCLFLCSNVR